MVTLKNHETEKNVVVATGDPVDVLMFYVCWQSATWKGWITDNDGDSINPQTKSVLQLIKKGESVLLSNEGKEFHAALEFAAERCESFGIDVVREY